MFYFMYVAFLLILFFYLLFNTLSGRLINDRDPDLDRGTLLVTTRVTLDH